MDNTLSIRKIRDRINGCPPVSGGGYWDMLKKNLEYLMARNGLNPSSLAKAANANQPTLFRILSGEVEDPRTATLKPIADYFRLSVEALRSVDLEQHPEFLGDGPAPMPQPSLAPPPNVSTPPRPIRAWDGDEELGNEYVTIPRLDLRASCGNGNVTWHIDEKGQPQAFRRAWCDRLGIDTTHAATIVADGDSMADRIQDGDSLVVDPTKKQLLDGKVYLICFDGEHFVKRIFKVPGVGLRVVSDNSDKVKHPDWDIPHEKADSLIIMGRVMGVSGGL